MKVVRASTFPSNDFENLSQILIRRTSNQEEIIFRYIENDPTQVIDFLTGKSLYGDAVTVARKLVTRVEPGSRIVLCFPPGLGFVRAFYGCLLAGMIAVPLPMPGGRRGIGSLEKISADCSASLLLSPAAGVTRIKDRAGRTHEVKLPPLVAFESLFSEPVENQDWRPMEQFPSTRVAWIQYTSGSTGTPKGVVISHANAMANARMTYAGTALPVHPVIASWLPHFHDMGLMMGVVGTLAFHGTAVITSPLVFLKNPRIWLEMIDRWKATTTAAPNFALDLCVQKGAQVSLPLDLSSLSTLVVGAEPVRRKTLESFLQTFGPFGLKEQALMPGYGLAESTLYVCSGSGIHHREGRVLCGRPLESEVSLVIVNPETALPLPLGQEGEIWIQGESIACGYWNQEIETRKNFGGKLENATDRGSFLRTGDLGILYAEGLVITSRLKDLIILRGVNFSPSDLEETMQPFHASFIPGGVAVYQDRESKVVAVIEVSLGSSLAPALLDQLRLKITIEHQVELDRIILIKKGSLPKTSSGKPQRSLVQSSLGTGDLPIVFERVYDKTPDLSLFRSLLSAEADSSAALTPLSDLGLDSLGAVSLVAQINKEYQIDLSITEFYELTTVGQVVQRIKGITNQPRSNPEVAWATAPSWSVTGMGLRLAGVRSVPAFWQALFGEKSYFSQRDGRTASWTQGIFRFDPKFFNISVREAALMDPQQRWLLAATVEALLDADYSPRALQGKAVGVFIGLSSSDFYRVLDLDLPRAGTGVAHSLAANRLSHFFGWTGPSLVVDSACSSSLVALDLAMKSLRDGSCDYAIVGGANFIFSHDLFRCFEKAGMLSPDGLCRPFDRTASGYVRGEGCGVILIERDEVIKREGRSAYAGIRGTYVGHNGYAQSLTAPNSASQSQIIQQALRRCQAEPGQVKYVEGHGTGTPLGDSIELRALHAVFGGGRQSVLPIGSIKSLFGHQEAGAGILGLIKALLLRNQNKITPQSNWTDFSPLMKETLGEHSPIRVASGADLTLSPDDLLGVSSFGFGGTNAHAVVQVISTELALHGLQAKAEEFWHESVYAPESSELLATLAVKREEDWA